VRRRWSGKRRLTPTRSPPPASILGGFLATPGAAHIDLAYAGGAAYQKRLLGFLELTLRARGGPRDVWSMSVV